MVLIKFADSLLMLNSIRRSINWWNGRSTLAAIKSMTPFTFKISSWCTSSWWSLWIDLINLVGQFKETRTWTWTWKSADHRFLHCLLFYRFYIDFHKGFLFLFFNFFECLYFVPLNIFFLKIWFIVNLIALLITQISFIG